MNCNVRHQPDIRSLRELHTLPLLRRGESDLGRDPDAEHLRQLRGRIGVGARTDSAVHLCHGRAARAAHSAVAALIPAATAPVRFLLCPPVDPGAGT